MDEAIEFIKEMCEYKIDIYEFLTYEEFVNQKEFIMLLGMSIMIKDYKMYSSNEELNKILLENRNELVHHNDISKDKNKEKIKVKLFKILMEIIEIL